MKSAITRTACKQKRSFALRKWERFWGSRAFEVLVSMDSRPFSLIMLIEHVNYPIGAFCTADCFNGPMSVLYLPNVVV